MSFSFASHGDYNNTIKTLKHLLDESYLDDLNRWGQLGVDALARATPVETGLTEESWSYKIVRDSFGVGIEWCNNNENEGLLIAILIQYGHGTGTGGYVSGKDYINPAIQPVFDEIENELWKKVSQ